MRSKRKVIAFFMAFILAITVSIFASGKNVSAAGDTYQIGDVRLQIPDIIDDDNSIDYFNLSYGIRESDNYKLEAKNVDSSTTYSKTYIKNGIQWRDMTYDRNRDLTSLGGVGHGNMLKLTLYIEAKSGYILPQYDNAYTVTNCDKFSVSGYDKGDKTKATIVIETTAVRYACKGAYDGITIRDVVEPIEGQKPVYDGFEAVGNWQWDFDESYNPNKSSNVKNGVLWKDLTDNREMRETDTFQSGHRYKIFIGIKPKYGFKFDPSKSDDFYTDYISVNDGRSFKENMWITRWFECKESIKSVAVENVVIPAEGLKPVYDDIKVPEDCETYELAKINKGNIKNGIEWGEINGSVWNPFSPSDKNAVFRNDHEYYVKVILKPREENKFDVSNYAMNGTVNGTSIGVKVETYSENEDYKVLILRVDSKKALSDIKFELTAPAIGEKPQNAKISSSIENALQVDSYGSIDQWLVSSDGEGFEAMTSTDRFEAGKYYRCKIVSEAMKSITKDKYILNKSVVTNFADKVLFYLNDERVTGDGVIDFGQLKAIDISSATVTGIEDKEFTGSPIPQKFEVKLGDTVLVYEADYDVVYENNTNVGEAKLKIVGIGDYTGEITKTFKITEKKSDPKKDDPKKDDPKKDDPKKTEPTTTQPSSQNNTSQSKTTEQAPATDSKTVDGIGTISKDGKTLKDETGVTYNVAEKVTETQLKKNAKIADKKSGGKYKITKITKKNGKVVGGTVEYLAPYNKNTKLISATGKVKLAGVTFTVTSIGNNCAKGCKKLTKVVIGENVTTIGKNAFNGCTKLKTIQIKSKKLKKVGANAFKGIYKKATISVPKTKKANYTKLLKGKGQAKTVKIK